MGSAHACEGIDHQADESAIAQAHEIRLLRCGCAGVVRPFDDGNAVQQLAGLVGRQHGRLASLDHVFGAAHGMGRLHLEDAAGHKPVKQHAQRGQVLLHGESTLGSSFTKAATWKAWTLLSSPTPWASPTIPWSGA
jgi:hypothetical protein